MPERAGEPLFHRAVLALNGGATDALVVRYGAGLAKAHAAQLVALHVVEVDWTHDLAEDLASTNEEASAILDHAEAIAEKYGLTVETDLLQARDVGAAIADEVAELGADLVVLGLPYRKKFGGDFAMGRTVPYVLETAACQVLILREPIPAAERPDVAPASAPLSAGGGESTQATNGEGERGRTGRLLSAVRGRR